MIQSDKVVTYSCDNFVLHGFLKWLKLMLTVTNGQNMWATSCQSFGPGIHMLHVPEVTEQL